MKFKANEDVQLGDIAVKAGETVELNADSQTAIDLVGAQKLAPVQDAPPPPPPPGSKSPDDEKIVVTRAQLKELVQEVTADVKKESQETIQKLREEVGMLVEISDKKQLSNWMSRHRKDAGTFVRLSTRDGKIVTAWKTLEDKVYKDVGSGRWHEKQLMRVTFDNNPESTEDMDYERFTDLIRTNQVTARVLERTEVNTEDPAVKKYRYKVKLETDGRELEIMDAFLN